MARKSSQLAQFWFEVTEGQALVQIPGFKDISFNFPDPTEIDATALEDTDSTTLPGTPGKKTMTVTFFDDFAVANLYTAISALAGTQTQRGVEIRYPQHNPNAKRAFEAIVVNAVPVMAKDATMDLQVTFQIVGTITTTRS